MKKGLLLIAVVLVFGAAPKASALLIDDFIDGATNLTVGDPGLVTAWDRSVNAATVLGGEREATAVYVGSPNSAIDGDHHLRVTSLLGGLVLHSQDTGVAGQSFLVYDGTGDANSISTPVDVNATGLGGIDLTQGGSSKFQFGVVRTDLAAINVLGVRVYTDATNYSELAISLPVIGSLTNVDLNFADFVALSGTGADFTNVGALYFFIDGQSQSEQGLDVTLSYFQTDEPVIPEPATLVLLGLGLTTFGAIRRRASKVA